MTSAIEILNKDEMGRALDRISHEILEKNRGAQDLALIGIKTRGEYLAKRLAHNIKKYENQNIPTGELDISLYRDDLSEIASRPQISLTEIPFVINEKNIILVDDVLYTGRTIRAALDAIMDLGRPASIQLVVLIDRGHRQLPIAANYIGKSVATAKKEIVKVKLEETDKEERVLIVRP